MARLAGVDLPREKRVEIGLTYIYGIGLASAQKILAEAKVNPDIRVKDLTDDQVQAIRKAMDGYKVEGDLRREVALNIKRLTEINANFRICKGIYIEPEKIAYKDADEIRNNFMKILRIALEKKSYCGIATHDEILIKESVKLVKELNLRKDEYEFQMLLGVKENLREEAVAKGHRMRIYVPFGKRWYEYSIRRFKENPNMAGQVLKSIFS